MNSQNDQSDVRSLHDVTADLRRWKLLSAVQLAEIDALSLPHPDPADLLAELVRRGWLTSYQAGCVARGAGESLNIGPYVVLDELSSRGTGRLLHVAHRRFERRAIARISPPAPCGSATLEEWNRQLRLLARLDHPHVVKLYDALELPDPAGVRGVLILEDLGAADLFEQVRQDGPLGWGRALEIVAQAADAVQYLHDEQIVHGRIAPEHLVWDRELGLVKLVGFGAARECWTASALDASPVPLEAGQDDCSEASSAAATLELKDLPTISDPADWRSDVVGLAETFVFLVTGNPWNLPMPPVGDGGMPTSPFATRTSFDRRFVDARAGVESLLAEIQRGEVPAAGELAARLRSLAEQAGLPAEAGRGAVPALPEYDTIESLGQGGMGTIYKARHKRLNRPVAIKFVSDAISNDNTIKQRFEREVSLLARLRHPNLITLYDAGETEGRSYLVMEYCNGPSLGSIVAQRGKLPVGDAVRYASQAARVLHYLHQHGVVHRDVSPGNLLLDERRDAVKLTDLGVARVARDPALSRATVSTPTDEPTPDPCLTGAGQIVGAPAYMSPEQWNDSHDVDHRSDIYNLGCTLFRLLTGEPPFGSSDFSRLASSHLHDPPPIAANVPHDVQRILSRAMAKPAASRFQSAAEMADALDAALQEKSDLQRTSTVSESGPFALSRTGASPPPGADQPAAALTATNLAPRPAAAPAAAPPPPQPALTSLTWAPPGGVGSPGYVAYMAPPPAEATKVQQAPHVEPAPSQMKLLRPGLVARVRGGLRRKLARWRERLASLRTISDRVDCTVFAPPAVCAGTSLMVQVFVHRPEQSSDAANMAASFDASSSSRGFKSLELALERGAKLTCHLALPGATVDDPVQTLIWWGRPASVQFGVYLPHGLEPGALIGTALVSHEGMPLGHVKFRLEVVAHDGEADGESGPTGESARQYRRAFVSYASQDRIEVLKRVQMLARLRIPFFQDVLDLEPGERWERRLYRQIDKCDLFLLFWSSSAQASRWVRKEVVYAIERKRGDDLSPPEILPIILEGPPPPEPFPELAHLHLNDYFTYFMRET